MLLFVNAVFTRTLAAVAVAGVVVVGVPGYAAVPGSVSGYALTVAGQPLANVAVEIFEAAGGRPAGAALQAARTGPGGAWTFYRLAPGDYVVRLTAGRQFIGLPVALDAGGSVSGVRLVAPSMAAAGGAAQGQIGAAAGAGAGGVTTAVVVAGAVVAAASVASVTMVVQDAS